MSLDSNIQLAYHTKLFADQIKFRLDTQVQSYLQGTMEYRGGITGNLQQIQGIGNATWRNASRHQPIPDNDITFPQRWLAPKPVKDMAFRYNSLDVTMLQLDPGSKLAESIVIASKQYMDEVMAGTPGEVGGLIGSAYEGEESALTTQALPNDQIDDGTGSTTTLSYQRLLYLNYRMDAQRVPRELTRWLAVTPSGLNQLYNNGPSMTQGRWGNADETQLQLVMNGQVGKIAGWNLRLLLANSCIASNAAVGPGGTAPADTDYCIAYTDQCGEFGQWGEYAPKITVDRIPNESLQPWLIYGLVQYGCVRYLDTRVIRVDVDVSA